MKVDSIQNNNPSFYAKLQLRGNTKLIADDGFKTIKEIVGKIGSETDIIDIALPMFNRFIKNKANINIACYVNGSLEQFSQNIEKTNILACVIAGLEKAKEIFSISNQASKEVFNVKEKTLIKATNKPTKQCAINIEDKKTQELLVEMTNLLDGIVRHRYNIPNYSKDFLKMGKHINDRITGDGYCAIHLLATSTRVDLMELLLKHPDIDIKVRTDWGDTPLHIASRVGYYDDRIIKLLE